MSSSPSAYLDAYYGQVLAQQQWLILQQQRGLQQVWQHQANQARPDALVPPADNLAQTSVTHSARNEEFPSEPRRNEKNRERNGKRLLRMATEFEKKSQFVQARRNYQKVVELLGNDHPLSGEAKESVRRLEEQSPAGLAQRTTVAIDHAKN